MGEAMRRLRTSEDEEQEVDISPLIDVVFILLIFFMVSTTFVKDAQLELERPSAQSAEPANTKSVRVSIDKKGGIYLGDAQVRRRAVVVRICRQNIFFCVGRYFLMPGLPP